jgi:non-ribosomal peptide synthetase component F
VAGDWTSPCRSCTTRRSCRSSSSTGARSRSESRADRLEAFLSADRRRGFALAEAPLSRLALIRVGASEHWLVWSHHHLLLDGWSLPILLGEVFEDYAALRAGRAPARAPAVPYRDYVAWIRRQDAARAEGFWRRALAGFARRRRLPWLGPRSAGEGLEAPQSAFEEQTLELGRERSEALRAFARRHRLTVNTLFQGAWALILARASREPDVVFGATVSGRPPELPGVESMVGLFINTLPLRARAEPSARLVPWLAALQERQAAARDFEWSPLADVQRWSEVPRGNALFDSLLVFENYPFDGAVLRPFDGVRVADIRAIERTNYALTLAVKPGESLELALGYPRSRLSATAAAGILGSLRTLLDAMLTRPEARLAELPLLTGRARARPRARRPARPWSSTTSAASTTSCARRRRARPPRSRSSPEPRPSPTPSSCAARKRLAARLRELGAGPEAVVGLCCERSLDGIVALLAILEAGAAYLPLDPSYPRERLAFQIRDAGVSLVLVPGRHAARIPESVRVLALDDREACAAEPRELAPVATPATSRTSSTRRARPARRRA